MTGPDGGALPADEVAEIAAFCAVASPTEYADLSRVEYEVAGSTVTLFEATRLDESRGGAWLRTPLARLHHDAEGLWTLHCFDPDSKEMRYDVWEPDFVQPTTVAAILDEIEADPTEIFWG